MTENTAQMIYYINSVIHMGMTYYGFICIFRPAVKKRWILLAYMAFLIISSQQFFSFDNKWANLIVNAVAFITISLFFAGNLSTKLVFASLLYILGIVADIISFIGLSHIYYGQYGTAMPPEYIYSVQRTVTNIIYAPLFLANILIFRRYFIQKASDKQFKIPDTHTLSILLIMAGIILLDALYIAASINEMRTKAGQIIFSQFCVLVIIILVIWLYNTTLRHLEALRESRLKDRMPERWETQYKTAMNSQKAMSESNHNLRFILMTLAGLLKEGNVDEAEKQLQKKLGEINYIINTGNLPIDTTLNYYQQKIREALDVEFETDLQIPPNMTLDAGLIVTILGNALENAIEACVKVAPSQRYIRVKASLTNKGTNNALFITITNPYTIAPVADKDGNLITTKPDNRNHGVGLASIQEMLPDNLGHIHFEYADNIFRFMLIFYNVAEYTGNNVPFITNKCSL